MRFLRYFGLLAIVTVVIGQSFEDLIVRGKEMINDATNHWEQKEMLKARAHFERILTLGEKEWLVNYYIAYCDYRLVIYALSQDDKKVAKSYLRDGINKLNDCIESKLNFAEAYALLSSLYGNKIALSPWTGFWYGPKSGKVMAKALTLAPENPRIHLIDGIGKYWTPETWGGGKLAAQESFKEAVNIFINEQPDQIMPDWGYSEAYGWLGQVELDLTEGSSEENRESAKMYFEKALEIDPDNGWVKYRLLPKLEKE